MEQDAISDLGVGGILSDSFFQTEGYKLGRPVFCSKEQQLRNKMLAEKSNWISLTETRINM